MGGCLHIALQQERWVYAMPEYIEEEGERGFAERYLGGWRVIASAWVVAIVFVALFAGVQALASLHRASPRQSVLAGAVIPRHDPSCAGAVELTKPSPPSCELDLQNGIERAEASYYGW